jgi:hypothetical protein
MQSHFQYSLRKLLGFVTALAIACALTVTWPVLGYLIATVSTAAFCASLRAGSTGTFLLHSIVLCLLIISAGLLAYILGTTVLRDPHYRVAPVAQHLDVLLVLIGGILLRYFCGYRIREFLGAIVLCEAIVFLDVIVQCTETRFFWWDYATALTVTFPSVIAATALAMICPNRRPVIRESR